MKDVFQGKYYYKDGTCFEGGWKKAPHCKSQSSIFHRIDGPAIELLNGNGTKYWYIDGKQHREDGPAVERANGDKEWYLNGKKLTTLSQEYLIRYMELTRETLATLLTHPDKMIRDSAKKYKWIVS